MPFWGIPIYSRKNLNIVNIVIFTLFFWFSFNQFHSSNIFEHDFTSWCRFVHSKDRFQRKLTAAPLRSQIASLAKDASWIHIYIYLNCLKWYFNDICMLLGIFSRIFCCFFFADLLKGSCSFQQSTGLQYLVISFHLRPNSSTISGNSYCANAG